MLNLLAAASLNVAAAQDGASIYAPAGTNSSGYSMGSESPLYNGLPAEYNNAPYVPPSGFIPAIRLNAGLTQSLLDFQNRQADKELLLIDPAFHGGTEGVGLTLNVTHFVISGVGIWESSVLFFLSDFMNLVDFCLLG